jgi:hypothetical protein
MKQYKRRVSIGLIFAWLLGITLRAQNVDTLSATPSSVSFGSVTVGNTSTQAVTLYNPSSVPINITQAKVTGTGFSISGLSVPYLLGGGQSTQVQASFAPASTGSFSGNISIDSTAANSPTTISLSGTVLRICSRQAPQAQPSAMGR